MKKLIIISVMVIGFFFSANSEIVNLENKQCIDGQTTKIQFQSQDSIVLRNGKIIVCSVKEIGTSDIKYSTAEYKADLLFSLPIIEIEKIVFADGKIKTFEIQPTLSENIEKKDLLATINGFFSSNCDGVLAWIPATFEQKFIVFVQNFLLEKNEIGELNFDNGGVAEAFGFSFFKEGLLVEMVDPECFSEIFQECMDGFCEQEGLPCVTEGELRVDEAFMLECCHMMDYFNKTSEDRDEILNEFFGFYEKLNKI